MYNCKPLDKIVNFFKLGYFKLIRIHDSPHNVAMGFGLGVFAGIMPFAGPIVAVFLAMLFKVNKISAFLGGLLANTWISFLAFLLSIKVGSVIFGIDGSTVRARWMELLKDFHLSSLFKVSAAEIILPVVAGYIVIALFFAVTVYITALFIMKFVENRKKA
jgi:hypothetical protein